MKIGGRVEEEEVLVFVEEVGLDVGEWEGVELVGR